MGALWVGLGLLLLLIALVDVVETIVLPRTVQRGFRLTPLLIRTGWSTLRPLIKALPSSSVRQTILVAYAPLTVVALILIWATMLIFGFSLIQFGYGTPWVTPDATGFAGYLYVSAVDFFTLGLGDVVTKDGLGRFLCVFEAGFGFGFLGLVVGYVPVFYNAFSRREVTMVLLDSKAGSDPTATEFLHRHAEAQAWGALTTTLKEYERWSAELLESYLSYPILALYRSQHDDQSWLITLTAILDVCALIEVGFEEPGDWYGPLRFQARATFAMARHVIVDLAYVLNVPPDRDEGRLNTEIYRAMDGYLRQTGLSLRPDFEKTKRIRDTYEPYVCSMARYLLVELPPWLSKSHDPDHWQTSAWDGVRHF